MLGRADSKTVVMGWLVWSTRVVMVMVPRWVVVTSTLPQPAFRRCLKTCAIRCPTGRLQWCACHCASRNRDTFLCNLGCVSLAHHDYHTPDRPSSHGVVVPSVSHHSDWKRNITSLPEAGSTELIIYFHQNSHDAWTVV